MLKLNLIGMELSAVQKKVIRFKLNQLAERSPFTSAISLTLEKRKSCIKGALKVQSFTENFHSTKITSDPIQTFCLLLDEIDAQLLEWKRSRFKTSLFQNNSRKMRNSERCA